MRKILFSIPFLKVYTALAVLMIGITLSFTLYLPTAIAEDATQRFLPEGAKARIGKGFIRDIAYSPNGTKLAVAGSTGVWLYDAETGEELNLLTVSGVYRARGVVFSPDGTTLAAAGTIVSESGNSRGAIHLWDIETGSLLRTMLAVEDRSSFDQIAFSPDGTTLVAVGTIGSQWEAARVVIHLWDIETGSLLRTMPAVGNPSGLYQIAFSPDGTTLAIPGATGSAAPGNSIWVVQLWDIETGSLLRTLTKDDTQLLRDVAFSPDGTMLAVAGSTGSEWEDRRGAIQLWDIETGSLLRTIPAVGAHSDSDGFFRIAFSPDGNIIASAREATSVQLWEVETGDLIWLPSGSSYANWWNDPAGYVYGVTFSPDGGTLAIMGHNKAIRLWDMDTGSLETSSTAMFNGRFIKVLSDAAPNPRTLIEHSIMETDKIAYSPDGTILAATGKWNMGRIVLWNAETGSYLQTLTAPRSIRDIAYSPDGTLIAAGSGDGAIYLWDLLTNEPRVFEREHEDFIQSVAFSPDGTLIASGAYEDSTVRLWDVKTGTLQHTLRGHQAHSNGAQGVRGVWFSPDGSTLASEGADETIRLWDVKTRTLQHTLRGHRAYTFGRGVAFSPDGGTLASRCLDKTICLWEVKTGNNFKTFDYNALPLSIAFSPDGSTLASAHLGGTILLRDMETGVIFKTFKYGASDIAFSPDGSPLASITGSSVITFWDVVSTPTTDADASREVSEDVNADGVVNISDLIAVATALGETGENSADVNADGVVNIQDLVAVAAAFGDAVAAAPSILGLHTENLPTRTEVEQWLHQALQANLTDPVSLKGIHFLEELLTAFTPKETLLLANYPNPFNPETWIPYQLVAASDVTVSIYATDGQLVRTLNLGHQPMGLYHNRSRAAYWDGRNAVGEPVASGIYFYTLTAGDFTATRKMLIWK